MTADTTGRTIAIQGALDDAEAADGADSRAAASGASSTASPDGASAAPPAPATGAAPPGPAATAPRTPATAATEELPYGAFLRRTLPSIQRAFRIVNRFYVLPAIRMGLGPLHTTPLTGAWMLLRTTGHRSGRRREAVVGYVILDGAVYCSAGFGTRTAWYRNLLAEPRVEIVLPAGGFAALAEPVTDPAELDRAWRTLIGALGVLGRAFVCRPDAPADVLVARTANLPLVRFRVTGLATGPSDPGGAAWIVPTALGVAWMAQRLRRRRATPSR